MNYSTPKVTIDLAEYNELLEAKKESVDIEQIQRFITLKYVLTATPEESQELIKYLESIQCTLECDYSSIVPKLCIYKHPTGGLFVRKLNK